MKLIYQIATRISIALLLLLGVWATIFYFIIIDEINDETDDSLEDYSEYLITRALAGETLPSADNGTNNTYFITEVTAEYAQQHKQIQYYDEIVYIESKKETEPARVLKTIFRDAGDRYHELTVSIPTIEKDDLQETILWWLIILYFFLLVGIIAVNVWIFYRSLHPLYRLIDWLDHFTLGKEFTALQNDTNITEFRKLNEAVVRNARRNIEMYEQQKLFIGNASHELQTPLAVCLNRLELLADDPSLTEKQLEEIAKTQQALEHIIKLNKTLLLLTKIENRLFPEQKRVNINGLLKNMIEDYTEAYTHRNIEVHLQENADLNVHMNETLARILTGNLLKNAFTHNHDSGSVFIRIDALEISFTNTGTEKALDASGIFKRFYQGAKKEGSIGLGLALADSICKLYEIKIRYDFADGKHRFTLEFPGNIISS